MKDDLKWVDDDYAAEKKKLNVPSPEQVALAEMLESCGGDYHAFITWTFRPNAHEEIIQKKDGAYTQNKKLSWTEGTPVVKRVTRNGGVVKGLPGISPGWSPYAAFGAVSRAIMKDKKGLAKSRWFMCIEGSKFRNCAHGHSLHSNASGVNWEAIKARWESQYGWFKFEVVDDDKPMAEYLCKQYVGKEYGKEDFKYAFSRNSRRPQSDPVPKIYYRMREMIYRNELKGKEKSHRMVSKRDYKKQLGEYLEVKRNTSTRNGK